MRDEGSRLHMTSDYHVYQAARDDDDLLDRKSSDELLDERQRKHHLFDSFLVGLARHADVTAFLAVHLYHEVDLILNESGGIRLRPGSREHVLAKFQLSPQVVRDMWSNGGEKPQQYRQAFFRDRVLDSGELFKRIQDLHCRGGH